MHCAHVMERWAPNLVEAVLLVAEQALYLSKTKSQAVSD